MFHPPKLTVAAGTVVTVVNQDPIAHTWTSSTGLWNSGHIEAHKSYSFTFTKAGTYAYHCMIHPYMMGKVVVT